MITRFKIFENFSQPQLGDYVAMKATNGAEDFSDYLTSTIGKIIEIEKIISRPGCDDEYRYVIKFDKYFVREGDFAVNQGEYRFGSDSIEFYSKNREDVEAYIASRKYNL